MHRLAKRKQRSMVQIHHLIPSSTFHDIETIWSTDSGAELMQSAVNLCASCSAQLFVLTCDPCCMMKYTGKVIQPDESRYDTEIRTYRNTAQQGKEAKPNMREPKSNDLLHTAVRHSYLSIPIASTSADTTINTSHVRTIVGCNCEKCTVESTLLAWDGLQRGSESDRCRRSSRRTST